jgi:outer membrane biogenesis lipoprotein LolB
MFIILRKQGSMMKTICLIACLLMTGCTLSYTVTQAHGSGSDIVDEDQKTDAEPNFTIPNPLNILKT